MRESVVRILQICCTRSRQHGHGRGRFIPIISIQIYSRTKLLSNVVREQSCVYDYACAEHVKYLYMMVTDAAPDSQSKAAAQNMVWIGALVSDENVVPSSTEIVALIGCITKRTSPTHKTLVSAAFSDVFHLFRELRILSRRT